jgi:hypothetical protein
MWNFVIGLVTEQPAGLVAAQHERQRYRSDDV